MVLDAAAGGSDFSNPEEQSLPSNEDKYANGSLSSSDEQSLSNYIPINDGYNHLFVNVNNLPQGMTIMGPRPLPIKARHFIQARLEQASRMTRRSLTQDEADALAFHAANALRKASFGPLIGGATALFFSYRSMDRFGFPGGWAPGKEGSRFSPDVFGPLKGTMARSGWHSLRFFAYVGVGTLLGQVFFGSYAVSTMFVGESRDPRLRDYMQSAKEHIEENRKAKVQQRIQEQDTTTQEETFEQRRQRRTLQERQRRKYEPQQKDNYNDASPTGGAFETDFVDSFTESAAAPTEKNDGYSTPSSSSSPSVRAEPQQSRQERRSTNTGAPESAAPGSSGNVWDRLRQDALNSKGGSSSASPKSEDKSNSLDFLSERADR